MSTNMNTVGGKARSLGVNTWLTVLGISLLIFGANTGYATWKAARLGGASSAASNLQVLSQQLANQGRDAVGGNAQAFTAFKATRNAIEQNVSTLQGRYGKEPGVSGAIATLGETWAPLGKQAGQLVASEPAVLALAGNANNFSGAVPGLQAQLNELVRAMSASGAPASQVYSALQQVVVAGSMARRVTEIRAGGTAAAAAGDFSKRISKTYEDADLQRFAASVNELVESVDRGITEVRRVIAALADADLTHDMDGQFQGAFAELQGNVNQTMAVLRQTMQNILTAAGTITGNSGELSSAANQLARRTEQQAASLEETAAALEEITTTVKDSTKRDLAIKFVQYIMSPEGQARLATSSCYWGMPANAKAGEQLNDQQKTALRWDKQPEYLKNTQLYPVANADLDAAMQDVWTEMLQQ